MMKDEAPYLLEWIAHHLAVGFTDILVYTNDCTDGTVEMLKRLEVLGLACHRPNIIPEGSKPQPSAIKHAQVEPLVQSADWVMLFDADEFLSINHPAAHLDGMLDDVVARGANGIVITWRIFGSGGVVDWSRAPVTEQYLRAAPPLWNKGWGVKTLFRFDPEHWRLGIHRPVIKNKYLETGFPDKVHWLNGSGVPMESYFKYRGWRSIKRTLGYNWAQMNHYAIKSVDSYALRQLRGNVNNKKNKYNADYWALQDRNEVEDLHILRHKVRRAGVMEALLTDEVLGALHQDAVERVERTLDEYKATPAYAELKAGLLEASRVPIGRIVAKPPKPRDPARIEALMHRVRKTGAASASHGSEGVMVRRFSPYVDKVSLPEQGNADWVENHGILLPADPLIFSAEALDAVLSGRFERRNARHIEMYLGTSKRVLEIGGGIGFVAMKALGHLEDTVFMIQDDRPDVIAMARYLARRNGKEDTSRLKFVGGPLALGGDAGRLDGLSAYIRDFRPDALRVNQSVTISGEQIAALECETIERILLPFVDADHADRLHFELSGALHHQGFQEVGEARAQGSLLFTRETE